MQAAGGGQNLSCEGNPVLVEWEQLAFRWAKRYGFFRIKHVETNP
jgi:hypothetical protein